MNGKALHKRAEICRHYDLRLFKKAQCYNEIGLIFREGKLFGFPA